MEVNQNCTAIAVVSVRGAGSHILLASTMQSLVSRGHTLLKNRKSLVNFPHHFRSLLQNLEEHTFTVLLMGRVRLDNERGRDHKTLALQCFTNFILELYARAQV